MGNKALIAKDGLLYVGMTLALVGTAMIQTDFWKGIVALIISGMFFGLRSFGKYKKIF